MNFSMKLGTGDMADQFKFASVIVDVPSHTTDRPFDYEIPEELADQVEIGCRVRVPFGPRVLQGYVVGVHAYSQVDNLRPIQEVVDLVPPLNEELVQLAEWMSTYYFSRRAATLEAMIPAVLKARYDRVLKPGREAHAGNLHLVGEVERQLMEAVQRAKNGLPLKKAEAIDGVTHSLIRKLIEEKRLIVEERVRDRVTRKRVTWVKPADSVSLEEQVTRIPANAPKQKAILQYFINKAAPVALPDLLASVNATRSSVMRLVELGVLQIETRESYRDPMKREVKPDKPLTVTQEQGAALGAIVSQLEAKQTGTFLLHGVTGSGKTEIYLQAIAAALEQGREAIVLVPEISLTPQMVERFKARFGERVAVLHSRLSIGERYDEWRKVLYGEVQVVIGARSAIFAPFRRIGLIIVDEEHESSYKQEENPRYHARDVAIKRAAHFGAVTVLGSATPSVETYYRAKTGEIHYLSLKQRVQGRPFPTVDIVDMRDELDAGNRSMFSRTLGTALMSCIERGGQAVLFLNRRGYATFVLCRQCGENVQCPHCDISLTYHRANRMLRCHYCGYAASVPETCPNCGSEHIRYFGTGTQKVERELAKHFPGLRIIRMDVDTTGSKGAHEKLLTAFREKKADVLLGTQMIAKGLDFPDVTLVGVIAADTLLGLPDFRAAERTFQLLMQVGGRAGRHSQPGHVVIQTYNPEHYSIQMAANYEITPFYRRESLARMRSHYPPFCSLIALKFSHPDQAAVMKASHRMTEAFKQYLQGEAEVLGPVRSPIFRAKDRYRMQTMIKYKNDKGITEAINAARKAVVSGTQTGDLRITIDRDPYVML